MDRSDTSLASDKSPRLPILILFLTTTYALPLISATKYPRRYAILNSNIRAAREHICRALQSYYFHKANITQSVYTEMNEAVCKGHEKSTDLAIIMMASLLDNFCQPELRIDS